MFRSQFLISITFSITVLLSAFLLFVVQPMVGSMVLPLLGGSSTVWTTCMLFFQTMLLLGYLYAHGLAQMFTFRRQVILHGLMILLALFFLPLNIYESILNTETFPALYLLLSLFLGIGIPMFVVASSAPLFQHWFGALDHPDADDPYYLYAASNAGSIIALLSYPFLINRVSVLDTQKTGWTLAFLVLSVLVGFCGLFLYRNRSDETTTGSTSEDASVSLVRICWWVLITFIPSSLMLGVTHYMTTDLASVPLLWVLPLAAYLLSYVVTFARLNHPLWLYRITLPAALLMIFAITYGSLLSHVRLLGLHITGFFMVSVYFHGELANDRPETENLTMFFIFVALGGSLGGLFNALLAPLIFDTIVEYYLLIGLSILVAGWTFEQFENYSISLKSLYIVISVLASGYYLNISAKDMIAGNELTVSLAASLLVGTILFSGLRWPWTVNLLLGSIFIVGYTVNQDSENLLIEERSFYGQYRVKEFKNQGRSFLHGTTQHGFQTYTNGEPVNAPTSYYHPDGPMGDIVLAFGFDRIGIGGLGVGGLAPYASNDSRIDFFEIDPVVQSLAEEYFSYLDECGQKCNIFTGDARQLIAERSVKTYDMIIMDAYTSDAIPTHLLTREAVKLYLSRVVESGAVVFHVSNRHLDLEGVIGAIVDDIGAVALTKEYYPPLDKVQASSSTYVVVARSDEALKTLNALQGWKPTEIDSTLWTDSHTSLVSVLSYEEDSRFESSVEKIDLFEDDLIKSLPGQDKKLP